MTGKTKSLPARVAPRLLLVACLFAGGSLASVAAVRAHGGVTPPPVPANLEVPEGHRAYLVAHAVGTQNQICLPRASGEGLGWTFVGPQATLFNDRGEQIATHFLSINPEEETVARATWQHSRDTSAVWAAAIASSLDPSYVEAGAVPWLLLEAAGTEVGPTWGMKLSGTTYIQRVNTVGGVAPSGDCPAVGARLFVPYTADYVFYRER
jgi:hypothetical protein